MNAVEICIQGRLITQIFLWFQTSTFFLVNEVRGTYVYIHDLFTLFFSYGFAGFYNTFIEQKSFIKLHAYMHNRRMIVCTCMSMCEDEIEKYDKRLICFSWTCQT